MIKAGKISAAITNNGELHIWGGNLTRANPLKVPNFNENIMDIRVGSERLYCLTSNGELFDFNLKNKNNEEIKVEKINISTTTILDFSIGDSHSLILGDIVGQASL